MTPLQTHDYVITERSALATITQAGLNGATATHIGESVLRWRDTPASARQLGYRVAMKLIDKGLIYSTTKGGKTHYYLVVDTKPLTLG
jgi:hypothetical protein